MPARPVRRSKKELKEAYYTNLIASSPRHSRALQEDREHRGELEGSFVRTLIPPSEREKLRVHIHSK